MKIKRHRVLRRVAGVLSETACGLELDDHGGEVGDLLLRLEVEELGAAIAIEGASLTPITMPPAIHCPVCFPV